MIRSSFLAVESAVRSSATSDDDSSAIFCFFFLALISLCLYFLSLLCAFPCLPGLEPYPCFCPSLGARPSDHLIAREGVKKTTANRQGLVFISGVFCPAFQCITL